MSKKFKLLALGLLFFTLAGCTDYDAAISNQKKFYDAEISNQKKFNEKITRKDNALLLELFDTAQASGNIHLFEIFLEKQDVKNGNQEEIARRLVAFQEIWRLTSKLDFWPGYIHFVTDHADAPPEIMQAALNRIFEIAYATAVKENTLLSYKTVLNQFPNAPEELQMKIVGKASILIKKDFDRIAREAMERFEMKESTPIDRANFVATELYALGIQAEDEKDRGMLMIISSVFETTPTIRNTTTYANFKATRKLDLIMKEIKELRADVNNLRVTLLTGIGKILSQQNTQFQELRDAIAKQQELINQIANQSNLPFKWDKSISYWTNIKRLGEAAIPYFTKGAINTIIGVAAASL
ncbi:exported hypothetical protein [Gammaproteobacteria bacterium]